MGGVMAGFRWTLVVTDAAEKYFTMEQALEIGNALGVDWSEFDVEQFRLCRVGTSASG